MFVNGSKMNNLYRGPSIDATYHVSVHLAKRFRSRRFLGNLPISNTNCLCWPCLLTDPKWAIFIEGLPKIAHFGSVNKHGQHRQFVLLIGRFIKNLLLWNRLAKWTETQNCLWWTCLLTDRDEMSILYRGPSIAATYQVSVHFAKRFQRRRFSMNRPISNTNCLCWPCLLTDPKLAIFIEGLP
jgi:hypothetical protein